MGKGGDVVKCKTKQIKLLRPLPLCPKRDLSCTPSIKHAKTKVRVSNLKTFDRVNIHPTHTTILGSMKQTAGN